MHYYYYLKIHNLYLIYFFKVLCYERDVKCRWRRRKFFFETSCDPVNVLEGQRQSLTASSVRGIVLPVCFLRTFARERRFLRVCGAKSRRVFRAIVKPRSGLSPLLAFDARGFSRLCFVSGDALRYLYVTRSCFRDYSLLIVALREIFLFDVRILRPYNRIPWIYNRASFFPDFIILMTSYSLLRMGQISWSRFFPSFVLRNLQTSLISFAATRQIY